MTTGFFTARPANLQRQAVAILAIDAVSNRATGLTRRQTQVEIDLGYHVGAVQVTPSVGEQWYITTQTTPIPTNGVSWVLDSKIPFNTPEITVPVTAGQHQLGTGKGPIQLHATQINANGPLRLANADSSIVESINRARSGDRRGGSLPSANAVDAGSLVYNGAAPAYSDGNTWIQLGTYDLPSGGIPTQQLDDAVQSALRLANTAFQLPTTGLPLTNLDPGVQTSLGLADTSLQNVAGSVDLTNLLVGGTPGSGESLMVDPTGTGLIFGTPTTSGTSTDFQSFLTQLDPTGTVGGVVSMFESLFGAVAGVNSVTSLAGLVPDLTNRLQYLDPNGLFNSQALDNIAQSFLRFIDPTTGQFDASQLTNINNIPALAQASITGLEGALANLVSIVNWNDLMMGLFGTTSPASYILQLASIPNLPISMISSLGGYLTNLNPSGLLSLTGLASGALPSGVTAAISQIGSLPGYLTNLTSGGMLAPAGISSGSLPAGVTAAISNVTSLSTMLLGLSTGSSILSQLIGQWPNATTGLSGLSGLNAIYSDVVRLMGNPTSLGSGTPVLPGAGSIPLLGGLFSGGLLSTSLFPTITAPMTTGLAQIDTLVQAWGGAGTGYGPADLTVFAQAVPNQYIQGLLGSSQIGGTVQNFVDVAVQNIQGNTATGNTFGILGGALGALTGFLGYTPGGSPPVASVANITSINNLHISSRSSNTNVFDGIDKTADAVFPFATWDGTTINVVEGTEAWGVISTPHGGLKEAVEFYGGYDSTAGTLGGLYISIYAFNANDVAGTQQVIVVSGIGNAPTSFTLTFNGQTTTSIAFGASARTVETALGLLPNIGPENVAVCGGPYWYVVNFLGTMSASVQPSITGVTTGGTGSLIGGTPTSYGEKTWLWTSNNLVTSPGVGNAMSWNYANIPNANGYFNSAQGEYFAVGIAIRGTATYTVAGQVHPAIEHPSAVPAFFGGTQSVWPSTQWATVGAARTGIQTRSGNETHTLTGQGNCLIVFANVYGGNTAVTGFTCKIGTTTVPLVWNSGDIDPTGNFNYLCAFALVGTAGTAPFTSGAKTVNVTVTGGQNAVVGMCFQSIAKGGVISVGTPQSATGTGTQAYQAYPDPNHGQMDWVNAFASLNDNFTDYSGAQAANFSGGAPNYPMIVGAGHGMNNSSNGLFASDLLTSSPWYGLTIPINTLWSPMQANQETTPTYSRNMPWFGLTGNPGVSQVINTYAPQLLYFGSSDTFDPADYPWANWFDIMIWGAGSGGNGGYSFNGGVAGRPGNTAAVTLARSQISGAPWTLSIPGASTGGAYIGSTPGAPGGAASVVVPGWSTLVASGGAQTAGTNGTSPYGQLGANAADINWTDAYGDVNNYPGGAGGANANASGGQPGGAGAGGNAGSINTLTYGGNGGAGFCYILVYQ